MMSPASVWIEATVDEVQPRTGRISSVFLRSAIGAYDAGQHVDVRLTAPDGYQAQRSYSIASAPGASRLELLVERLDEGEVSPYFTDVAQPGDTLELRGPIGGHFVWRTLMGGPVLLIAGGSGIAPLLSIARHWSASAAEHPLTLLYSARSWDALACIDELLERASRPNTMGLVITTTRAPKYRPHDFDRRIDREMLRDVLARIPEAPRHTYICGSTAFVDAAATALTGLGIAAATIRTERFGGTG